MLNKRRIEAELLDHLPPGEGRRNLADIVRLNARFGGHSVLRETLRLSLNQGDAFSLLDVGAASGDSARLIQQIYPYSRVVSLDYNFVNLELAPFSKVVADAFSLPFAENSIDYVVCSLFLHHFVDAQVVELLRSFYAVARKGLFVFDLERHIIPYLFLPATRLLFGWDAITVSDGVKSVQASFQAQELANLAQAAGVKTAEVRTHRPAFRVALRALK